MMATALVETPLPEYSTEQHPSEAHTEQQETEDDNLHWADSLSPRKRSCINLSNVEPCVNKAIAHLGALKKHLTKPTSMQLRKTVQKESEHQFSRAATPKSILVHRHGTADSTESGRSSKLVIEGVSTGIPVEKDTQPKRLIQAVGMQCDWLEADDIIDNAIHLVARLEHDRQETLERLEAEKIRVQQLVENLDRECEKRLNLLPRLVQKEHEECMRDLLELKWHVAYESRMLARIEDDLRIANERNEELKNEVDNLTSSCPLLEEKLVVESDHMSDIAQQQQNTSDELNRAKHNLLQTEDKSHKAHRRAEADREKMEESLDEIRMRLAIARNQLKEAQSDCVTVSHQMNECHKKIAESRTQGKELDAKIGESKVHQSTIQTRVNYLRDDYKAMEAQHHKMDEKIETLKEKQKSEHGNLEAEYVVLLSAMQQENQKLRQARDGIENLEQENDTLKERIASCIKQTHDDEKSVERAHRELVKLDQQLGVSVAQFNKVREEHFITSEEFKSEETKAANVEHSLKSNIEVLKHQHKDQSRTKLTYEGKIKARMADLDKLMAECRRTAEKAEMAALKSEEHSQIQTDIVTNLEADHSDNTQLLESLRSQLASVQGEHATTEKELSERKSVLTPQEKQLREEVQEKVATVETVSERIKTLERKLEDVVKSTAMLVKMEGVTSDAIEQLNSQLCTVKEDLAAEKKEEQSWREELKEISDFSSDAKEKHKKYLEERSELLKKSKLDLHKALSTNTTLAEHYHHLQQEFLEAKKLALNIMERKLDMEASLRDHKQLLAFQSCIYSTMKAYYEHRGVSSRRELAYFHDQSKQNMQQLKSLRDQFQTVITMIQEFLEHDLQVH